MQPRPIVGSSHLVLPSVLFCIGFLSNKHSLLN
jgi:hypothetical protein